LGDLGGRHGLEKKRAACRWRGGPG
jgi:hypothetical protein